VSPPPASLTPPTTPETADTAHADAGSDATASVRAQVAQRFERLAALGFTRDRILQQLVQARFPAETLKPLFPEFPATAFEAPKPPELRRGRARATPVSAGAALPVRVLAPSDGSRAPAARPGAADLLERLQVTTRPTSPVTASSQALVEEAAEGLSFQYVPLIQCSFPHADPGEVATFTRRNGWLELTLATNKPTVGLPYGVPARLLTIFLSSEAIRTRSPEIFLGESVHEFLRRLDVPITRGERGSLRVYANQLLRLIHCSLSVDENVRDDSGRHGLHLRQALFAEEARLWWDDEQESRVGQGSSLVLSPVLFESILERSAPLSTAAIKQLRKSPMDLDVYAWLVHRLFHLGRPSTITWAQLSGQFGHGYAELRKFRRFFADSLKRVLEVYPEAQVRLADVGVILSPSRPHLPSAAGSARSSKTPVPSRPVRA
jgi:hypothetical protein